MNKKIIKTTACVFSCFAMALSPIQALAKTSQITIYNNGTQSMIGKKFELFQLFHVEKSLNGNSVLYTINQPYADYIKQAANTQGMSDDETIDKLQSMNTEQYELFTEKLSKLFTQNHLQGQMVDVSQVNPDGSFTIDSLDYGYYMIRDITEMDGRYEARSLLINTVSDTDTIYLKNDYPSIIEKKIFENNNNTGWNDIADYEIGQEIPFKYEVNVKNMEAYSSYYFSMHDEMDKAFDLIPSSMKVEMESNAKTSGHVLSADEYELIQSQNTFEIRIQDFNALVKKYYSELEPVRVKVSYKAKLNEQARLDTGNPGFENKVRLEYSNDPYSDTTGFTPWDSVVCYTYKVDVNKQNQNKVNLQDAHFKLYSDPQCKNEVYCFKTNEGYVRTMDALKAETLISDAQGNFSIVGLDQGTYYLKEIQAPKGYRLLAKPIQIDIQPVYQSDRQNYISGHPALQSLTMQANRSMMETNLDTGSGNVVVVNKSMDDLPFTGSNSVVLFSLAGAGFMMVACLRKQKQ